MLCDGFCVRWVCAGSVRQLLIMAKNLPLTDIGLCNWPEVTLNEIDNTKLKLF